ncbi:hypothetical protein V502_10051, partial [Pseudogymnoascus sp. VKM F-4520 (FW-2644)]
MTMFSPKFLVFDSKTGPESENRGLIYCQSKDANVQWPKLSRRGRPRKNLKEHGRSLEYPLKELERPSKERYEFVNYSDGRRPSDSNTRKLVRTHVMHNYRHKQEIAAPLKPRLPLPPAILLTKEATIYALSPSSQFADERESYYFHHYCNETATQITGPFSSSLWIRLVPQISETTPFIKHAILALGALSKSRIDIFQQHGVYDSRNVSLLNSHHQYALLQYSKTLKGIREASQDSSKDSITALIACLLVFCFECWQRHQAAATAHAATAVTLISQLRFKQNGHACVFSDACIPRYLDVDLYSAFSGLDLQALLFVDNRTTTMHQTLQDGMCSTIQGIPVKFSDLQQCRNYWQIIMRRNLHFVAAARAATFNTVTPKD